jgi:hypothetical protein
VSTSPLASSSAFSVVTTAVQFDATGPLSAYVEPPQACAPLRPLVRWMSDVPGAGPGRIYEDLVLQPLAPQNVLEDTLSKWETANITHSNEQHTYHRCVF